MGITGTLCRGASAERQKEALAVVKRDPFADDPFGLEAVGQLLQMHCFVFEGTPKGCWLGRCGNSRFCSGQIALTDGPVRSL